MTKDPIPHSPNKFISDVECAKRQRSSNFELYRIICMIMIVAHHYVVNSGLTSEGGVLLFDYSSANSIFLSLFGAWGKTGINCFMMITGFFMCTSKITFRKFVKLMGQIYLYKLILYLILFLGGYETLSVARIAKVAMPTWGFSDNFTGCFIGFWLTIPFLNILVNNMNKRQHGLLLLLMLVIYTFLGSIPTFHISFNYITWFCIIFFIASYIRLYPIALFKRKKYWGWITLIFFVLACTSIVVQRLLFGERMMLGYSLVSDCNKIFAVVISVCSFLWFKNMSIKYSKVINAFGAGTFGVFLIHANSDAMRTWLWKDTVDAIGHYATMNTDMLALYSFVIVLLVFVICNLIDQLRIATLEKWFLRWYDNKLSVKANTWINKMTSNKQ